MYLQKLTPLQALPKAKSFCAYQERCHSEVKEKLYGYGLNKKETAEIMATLIEENYLSEERYAIAFAGGHFRTKSWGKLKIKYQLKQKQISDYCIKKALKQISEEDYLNTLQKLVDEKWQTLKALKNNFIKKYKLQNYLLQKGYELDLIKEKLTALE